MPRTRASTRATAARIEPPRRRRWWVSLFKWLAISGVVGAFFGLIALGVLWFRVAPTLPEVDALRDVQLQMPMRVLTAEGELIAEYGEKRREPVFIDEVPQSLIDAILVTEDKSFYNHIGVSPTGLARAGWHLLRTGTKGPGGSTITMQVARNFFLTNERTYARKIREIFLALKIERELTKDEILELYLNKIYLGNRSYGFAAASKAYYNKKIGNLEVAEAAMLAGLPKAPSANNPIVNPERALERRNYVLRRMREENKLDPAAYAAAVAQPDTSSLHYSKPEAEAHYVGEMARARVKELFGSAWSTAGYRVFTTIRSDAQRAANDALRNALYDYEARHGYRGPLDTLDPALLEEPEALMQKLGEYSHLGGLSPAAVIAVAADVAVVVSESGSEYPLGLEQVEWARERIGVDELGEEITAVDQVLAMGDVIHVVEYADGTARFVQEPSIEGAFVAMDPRSGEILALVGGFDFRRSKFNRVTQARRQPGSTFKPFIYSAALDLGDTAATIYNDAPVVFHDDALEDEWRPSNYSGRFFGPTRLREALVKSRNLVSIRVLREIGIENAIAHASRFGFNASDLPEDLSLALGSATVTPMEMDAAFAVFANGGYRVQPHFVSRIEDPSGQVVYEAPQIVLCDDCTDADANPLQSEMEAETRAADPGSSGVASAADAVDAAGATEAEIAASDSGDVDARPVAPVMVDVVNAPRVLDERNAFIVRDMLKEVVRRGTARSAGEALGRGDLAGKTGTTNDQLDAWFVGFNPDAVATVWLGSDGLEPLGRGEAGGIAALPAWTEFMSRFLAEVPEAEDPAPDSVRRVRISRETGEAASGEGTMLEWFYSDNRPEAAEQPVSVSGSSAAAAPTTRQQRKDVVEQLF